MSKPFILNTENFYGSSLMDPIVQEIDEVLSFEFDPDELMPVMWLNTVLPPVSEECNNVISDVESSSSPDPPSSDEDDMETFWRLSERDVIAVGKGAHVQYHRGNMEMRDIIRPFKVVYASAPRSGEWSKKVIRQIIIDNLCSQGRRFLVPSKIPFARNQHYSEHTEGCCLYEEASKKTVDQMIARLLRDQKNNKGQARRMIREKNLSRK